MIWYIRLAALAAVLAALAWLHHHVYEEGYDARDVVAQKEMKAEKTAELAADAEAEAKLTAANQKIDALNLTMTKTISTITTQHQQEVSNAQAKITQLNADLRSTKLRLSIAVTNPASPGSATAGGQGTGPGAGTSTEARVELSESASEFLVGFAGQCDANTNQLNAVIDAYNALKEAVNAQPEPSP